MDRGLGLPVAGAVAVALLSWYTAVSMPAGIERDLLTRASAALRAGGIESPAGGGLRIDGQTATLSGPRGSAIVSEDSRQRVAAVWGISDVVLAAWDGPGNVGPVASAVPLPEPIRIPSVVTPAPAAAVPPSPQGAKFEENLAAAVNGRTVAFRGSTDVLLPDGRRVLDDVSKVLRSVPKDVNVEIAAHTDSDGDDAKNLALSKRRAASVRRYLVSRGAIRQNRLRETGYGETKPIAPNDTDENKARNRRIEFHAVAQ